MNVRFRAVLAPALLLAMLPATRALAHQEGGAQEGVAPESTAAAVPPAAGDDRVINMILAKVDSSPIFLTEFHEALEGQLVSIRAQYPEAEIEAQLPELRIQTMAALIDDRMMEQRADELQIVADANTVDRAIENMRQRTNTTTDEEFAAVLAANGLTLETLRDQMRRSVRQQMLASMEVQRGIFVSESDVEAYYAGHPELFEAPEQVRIEQLIFVGGQDLREQAVEALAELRAGAPLADVAASYPAASPFPVGDQFVRVPDLTESLAEAVPTLTEGEFSEPIRSQFGWHLVRVVERQAHSVQPIDEVRENIRQRLLGERSNERMMEYLSGLRERTHLEILAPEFASVEELWRPAEETGEETATDRD